jgi:hypothetical protein
MKNLIHLATGLMAFSTLFIFFCAYAQSNDSLDQYKSIRKIMQNQETAMHKYKKNAKNVIFKLEVNARIKEPKKGVEPYINTCKRIWQDIGSGSWTLNDGLKPSAIYNAKETGKLEELLYQNALANFKLLKNRSGENSKEYEILKNSGYPYLSFEGFESLPSYQALEKNTSKDVFIERLNSTSKYEKLKSLNPLYLAYEETYSFPPYKLMTVISTLVGRNNNPIIAHFVSLLDVDSIEINADFNWIKENNVSDRYYYNTFGNQSLLNGLSLLDGHIFMWRLASTKVEGGFNYPPASQ